MEYNTNTYVTIAKTTCVSLGLGEKRRMNNDGTISILEFKEGETIPLEIAENIIDTYTHQEALTLINTAEWKSNLQL